MDEIGHLYFFRRAISRSQFLWRMIFAINFDLLWRLIAKIKLDDTFWNCQNYHRRNRMYKNYVHVFFLVYLKTLMEVGAPGDIGLNAAPPVVIWALENVIDYAITPSHRMAGKPVRVRSLTSNFATSHHVLKVHA